ncbi:serine hydrolase FSH [Aspergillus avenaceus]|uniref:Serine hydrolase FSH n=1 Tax=Aspergillus avenaceus TaxID=36643 RepID=A0A5N6TLF7_ASPAV|nr:serine hydrolase FSH [Aspergillus avenaceus]
MKILCLHGKGTSAAIFKSQTTSMRARLKDPSITFDFIDGPYTSTPAPGIDLFYPPPYYSFWEEDAVTNVLAARDWLLDVIAKQGPYDAVMGFSQGCSLGATVLLRHAYETPFAPPPFKAAFFICGGAPLGILETVGYRLPAEIREGDLASRRALMSQADSRSILEKGRERWDAGGEVVDVERVRGVMEGAGEVKIAVPSVHVYGSRDPRFVAGVQLSGVAVERGRRCFDHGGGHDIPRTEMVSLKLAELVRWVLKEGSSY